MLERFKNSKDINYYIGGSCKNKQFEVYFHIKFCITYLLHVNEYILIKKKNWRTVPLIFSQYYLYFFRYITFSNILD